MFNLKTAVSRKALGAALPQPKREEEIHVRR